MRSESITDMDEDPAGASPVSLPSSQVRHVTQGLVVAPPSPQVKVQTRPAIISTSTS